MKITQEELAALVDEPYRSRGHAYFQEGLVDLITITPNYVKAKAMGSSLYHITLKRQKHGIEGDCSCPVFEGFGPCKHMAAVGFALIYHETQGGYEPSDNYFDKIEVYKAAESCLSKASKNELITFILRLAIDDPEILKKIEEEL